MPPCSNSLTTKKNDDMEEIKVGDKVRVSKDAPKVYTQGSTFSYTNLISVIHAIDGDAAIIGLDIENSPIYNPPRPIPTKYLVKVEEEKPKFKVNDVVFENGNYYLYGMGNEYPEKYATYEATIDNVAMDWEKYTADLAKEIAIVYAKQKRDVRMAVRAAKSVVEELKKK